MNQQDYEAHKKALLSRDGWKLDLRWDELTRGQRGVLSRLLREKADREYIHDLKASTPEGCW